MPLLDHAFAILIAIIYPLVGFIGFRRLLERAAAGEKVDRSKLYRNTLLGHWILMLMFVALWAGAERTWSMIGFGLQADRLSLLAGALTVAGIILLVLQIRQVRSATPGEVSKLRSTFDRVSILVPHNRRELNTFYALSVTAGIVEEILWRGFLIWYLALFMPFWAAAVLNAVGFGIAHAYQGARQVPQIMLAGGVFTGLFVLSGSLWLPIVFHIAVDILQGRFAYEVVTRDDESTLADTVTGANVAS